MFSSNIMGWRLLILNVEKRGCVETKEGNYIGGLHNKSSSHKDGNSSLNYEYSQFRFAFIGEVEWAIRAGEQQLLGD